MLEVLDKCNNKKANTDQCAIYMNLFNNKQVIVSCRCQKMYSSYPHACIKLVWNLL